MVKTADNSGSFALQPFDAQRFFAPCLYHAQYQGRMDERERLPQEMLIREILQIKSVVAFLDYLESILTPKRGTYAVLTSIQFQPLIQDMQRDLTDFVGKLRSHFTTIYLDGDIHQAFSDTVLPAVQSILRRRYSPTEPESVVWDIVGELQAGNPLLSALARDIIAVTNEAVHYIAALNRTPNYGYRPSVSPIEAERRHNHVYESFRPVNMMAHELLLELCAYMPVRITLVGSQHPLQLRMFHAETESHDMYLRSVHHAAVLQARFENEDTQNRFRDSGTVIPRGDEDAPVRTSWRSAVGRRRYTGPAVPDFGQLSEYHRFQDWLHGVTWVDRIKWAFYGITGQHSKIG